MWDRVQCTVPDLFKHTLNPSVVYQFNAIFASLIRHFSFRANITHWLVLGSCSLRQPVSLHVSCYTVVRKALLILVLFSKLSLFWVSAWTLSIILWLSDVEWQVLHFWLNLISDVFLSFKHNFGLVLSTFVRAVFFFQALGMHTLHHLCLFVDSRLLALFL